MAIQTKKKYKGQKRTDVLSGKLRLEVGNNRLIVVDETGRVRILIGFDKDGF